MATFLTTIKFSQQGIKDIDHTTKRAAIFKAEAKKLDACNFVNSIIKKNLVHGGRF